MLKRDLEKKVLKGLIKETFSRTANRTCIIYSLIGTVSIGVPAMAVVHNSPIIAIASLVGGVVIGKAVSNYLVMKAFDKKCKNKRWSEDFYGEFNRRVNLKLNKLRVSKSIYDGRYAIPEEELSRIKDNVLHQMTNK